MTIQNRIYKSQIRGIDTGTGKVNESNGPYPPNMDHYIPHDYQDDLFWWYRREHKRLGDLLMDKLTQPGSPYSPYQGPPSIDHQYDWDLPPDNWHPPLKLPDGPSLGKPRPYPFNKPAGE